MEIKTNQGHQYSYEEMSLITAARPNPIFESARWHDYNGMGRYVSFNMCDFGMELGLPLLVTGYERADIINATTGKILYKDCSSGEFDLLSPESMYHKIGSAVGGPYVYLPDERYNQIANQSPCCLVQNVVFTNGIVDMVVGRFICPITPFVEKKYTSRGHERIYLSAETEIYLHDVSYRFSEKIDSLSLEAKRDVIFMHPDVNSEGFEFSRSSISKSTCPEASTLYCSDELKQAFENGETVEAVVIKGNFLDNNSYYAKKGAYTFEATLEGCNRKYKKHEWVVLSQNNGTVGSNGKFSFDTVVILWKSKEEADKEWDSFYMSDLNASLVLKVRNGYAEERLKGMAEDFGVDFLDKSFMPDT